MENNTSFGIGEVLGSFFVVIASVIAFLNRWSPEKKHNQKIIDDSTINYIQSLDNQVTNLLNRDRILSESLEKAETKILEMTRAQTDLVNKCHEIRKQYNESLEVIKKLRSDNNRLRNELESIVEKMRILKLRHNDCQTNWPDEDNRK